MLQYQVLSYWFICLLARSLLSLKAELQSSSLSHKASQREGSCSLPRGSGLWGMPEGQWRFLHRSADGRLVLFLPCCPGRLWSLLLWRYSRPAWTRSCAACSRWPCFSRGLDWVTHRGPCEPLPFCHSVILFSQQCLAGKVQEERVAMNLLIDTYPHADTMQPCALSSTHTGVFLCINSQYYIYGGYLSQDSIPPDGPPMVRVSPHTLAHASLGKEQHPREQLRVAPGCLTLAGPAWATESHRIPQNGRGWKGPLWVI